MRLAALMQTKVIYVLTHDSIGLGEDGPTHQPIEQLAGLRAIPGLRVIRPADANEVAMAWQMALEHDGPTALVLARQGVETLTGQNLDFYLGGYALKWGKKEDENGMCGKQELCHSRESGNPTSTLLSKSNSSGINCCANVTDDKSQDSQAGFRVKPGMTNNQLLNSSDDKEAGLDLVLVATGSEVSLAFQIAKELETKHEMSVRVVSLPCWEVLREQDQEYLDSLLPADVRIVGIEAACSLGWGEWVDEMIAIEGFGASAPGEQVMEEYGFAVDKVVQMIIENE